MRRFYHWITNGKGKVVNTTVTAPGANAAFDGNADYFNQDDGVFITQDGQLMALSTEYEHQVFGIWETGLDRSTQNLGAGSFGTKTSAGSLPSGNATYNGQGVGHTVESDGTLGLVSSNVTISTDFSTASVSSTSTEDSNGSRTDLDFSGSGPVSGSGFLAPVSGSGGLAGDVNGQFYGNAAQEVGGTFGLEAPGGASYIGSFGASQ